MEVHHHAHTARKKWTHYFWEFLMLFLAVFCGFLAEYKLEHVIEHNREKIFMETLLEDLKDDTLDLKSDLIFWDRKIKRIDSLKTELNKKPTERNSKSQYRYAATVQRGNSFLFHDRTLQQLKNSGNFRLIRKRNVSEALSAYDSYILNTVKNIEQIYSNNLEDLIKIMHSLFNEDFFQLANNSYQFDSAIASKPGVITMRKRNDDLFFEFYNSLTSHIRECRYRMTVYHSVLKRATDMIALIKKEYHLK